MATILNIDTTGNFNSTSNVILDDVNYIIEIYYNNRNDGWYISFYNPDTYDFNLTDNSSAMLYGGRKLMPNQDVLSRIISNSLPSGALVCLNTEGNVPLPPISKDNFGIGKEYQLVYYTEEELN